MEQITQALDNIGFDLRLAVAHFINFLIVFVVLTKFVFKPLAAKIDERNRAIEKGLSDAERAKKERRDAETKRDQVLHSARQDAQAILAEAKHRDEAMHDAAVARSKDEANRLQVKAKAEVERQRKQAEADFRNQAADLVTAAAEKLVAAGQINETEAKQALL